MYKKTLRVFGEYLIEGKAIPVNATHTGDKVVRAGKSMSGLEVVAVATVPAGGNPVSIPANATVTITVQQSLDSQVFIPLPTKSETKIEAGKTTFEDGEVIARMTLPYDCMPFIKGNLTTAAAPAATGNVDLFLAYLPR